MALITAEECIEMLIPAKNMDEALLEDSIPLAELKYIRKTLGADFYDLLEAEVQTQQFTGLHADLLTLHLKPLLARYVVYEALPLIKAEISSQGLQSTRTEFTMPASDADYGLLRNKLLSDAELLLAEMKVYLKTHKDQFPLYLCDENISGKNLPYLY